MKRFSLNWKVFSVVGTALLAVLVLLNIAGGPPAVNSFAYQTDGVPLNSISVSGTGEVSGTPDVAYVDLGVNIVDSDAGSAVVRANETIAAVIAAVNAAGVAPEDIQTSSFNVYSEDIYDPQTGQQTGERNYRAQNTVRVTVRDIATVGAVIDAGLDAGANNIYGLSFGIADTSALEQEARVKAVEDARSRAQQLADAFGVTLGAPVIISESFNGGFPMPFAREVAQAGFGGGGSDVQPGQLAVSVQINVAFSFQ